MKYMEVSGNYRSVGTCSDDDCPCGFPGASIPKGEGYMYVSKNVVDFRKDCLSETQAKKKIDIMSANLNAFIASGSGVFAPILMCELGARKRGINLKVAADDARNWWQTGKVPLRVTPLAGENPEVDESNSHVDDNNPDVDEKKWWQFWK